MAEITLANSHDLDSILSLMDENGLPRAGIEQNLATTLVLRDAERLIGNVTLEMYGRYALLRSAAVAESRRGSGIGQRLTQAALDYARKHDVDRVYLLTETAREFFQRFFGFKPIERNDVPAEVKESIEFKSACPVSALVMECCLTDTVSD